jgi:polar amino acid transport system permease protein
LMEFLSDLNFGSLWRYREPLAWGLLTTLWLSAASFAIAMPAGLVLALGRLKGWRPLRLLIMAFVDLMRFTPLLVQAVWIHFALPALIGYSMTASQSGLIALSLHVSAYVSETIRAGIIAIPKGQWEAGRALGLDPRKLFLRVILPQVWPLVIPPLANLAVSTFKLTAILGILAIDDLMKVANRVNNMVFRPFEVFTTVALIYVVIGLALAAIAAAVERRYGRSATARYRSAARPDRLLPDLALQPLASGERHGV